MKKEENEKRAKLAPIAARCRKGSRMAMAFLEIILLTFSAACLGLVSSNAVIRLSGRPYYVSPFSKTESFEDADVFHDILHDSLDDVVRYCVIRGQMETDGVFDEKKEIDIEQYARHFEEVPVTETSVAYRLGDLIQWGQSRDGISTSVYSVEDVEEMIRKAHGIEEAAGESAVESVAATDTSVNEETIYIREDKDSFEAEYVLEEAEYAPDEAEYASDGTEYEKQAVYEEEVYEQEKEERYVNVPIERYLPADGQSILAHVESPAQLEQMVTYLNETVYMLKKNYISYKKYQDMYDQEKTNFRYCVLVEKDGKETLYSNAEIEGTDRQDINGYFAGMGKYLCFSPSDFTFESNTSVSEEEVRGVWEKYHYAYSDDVAVWIGVDTRYLYEDAFQSALESYRTAPGYPYILLSIISGIAALAVLLVLTVTAGRKDTAGRIGLCWFDRWYTEISAGIGMSVVFILFALTFIGVGVYRDADDQVRMMSILIAGSAVTGGAALFFYLSLVRRIKARIFWKNFLIYRLFLKLKKILMGIYDDSRNVVRLWVPYLIFTGVNLLLISADNPGGPGGGTFAAVVLDLCVGVFLYRNNRTRRNILDGIGNIRNGDLDYQIDVEKMHGDNRILAEAVNSIGNGIRQAVETSMKDERMKADLITNVSHDIKTPLTSIINYVDLIKREPIDNEKIKNYLKVLESKSQRLKQLTEDLVEVSKISSGNIELQCSKLDLVELMHQALGEFVERFEEKGLHLVVSMEESPLLIYADARRIWRVVENLFQNVSKYAMDDTRVYVETKKIAEESGAGRVRLSIKNISDQPLNMDAEDLTERFIRGDVSRTTEGSGLGLSIAKNLTELQKGRFEIFSDGDLFKVVLTFALVG